MPNPPFATKSFLDIDFQHVRTQASKNGTKNGTHFKLLTMPKTTSKNWTDPVLVPKNPTKADIVKEWRVRFNYFNEATGKWQPVIRKNGINYIHNFNERLAACNILIIALKRDLSLGWNPLTNTFASDERSDTDIELERLKSITFTEALDFAFSKKQPQWAHKTKQDYSSVIKYIKLASKSLDIHKKKIAEFKLPHFRLILEEVVSIRKLSPKGFNKFREYLSSLVAELVSWEVVEFNLVHHVKAKPVIKTMSHRPPTTDQRDLIIGRIKTQHREYYRFLCVLYGCTLRPKEITRLKIKDLHRKEQVFRIIPVKDQSNSKVNFERETCIPNWVMDILSEMNLHNYDPEYYIFSSEKETFMPGKTRMHSNTPTSWWRKIVKEELGQDVNQYSLKKLAGNDMVKMQRMEGVDKLLELPKMQFGHTSDKMVETYVTEHIEIMKDLVKNKMPVL